MSKDGGPAFPVVAVEEVSTGFMAETAWRITSNGGGMSLRDYFAAKFAAAWVVTLGRRWQEPACSDLDIMHEANRRGLEQANAMLKARGE